MIRLKGMAVRVVRSFSSKISSIPRIAIIGSGPAGFYTAQHLLKSNSHIQVDIYEKLVAPYGLVRYGVAPDHPEVKNVISTFSKTAKNDRCRWIGNVEIGKDIKISDLRKAYSALVFSYGCQMDKLLDIPGENLNGVYSAREFVEWYNGLPSASNLNPNLDSEDAVILGQGNVAIDVARMFLSPIDELRKTDISEHALEKISKSRVKRVHLIGRRGPLQAACTIAELRELTKLPNCLGTIAQTEVEFLRNKIKELPRPKKRMMELMLKISDSSLDNTTNIEKFWNFSFFKSPIEFLPCEQDSGQLGKIRFSMNKLQDDVAVPTGDIIELSTNLAFRSIGYKGVGLPDLPFDAQRGLIPNEKGRIINERGLYCSGWIKRGPTGVIATTMNDGFETAKTILKDIDSSKIEVTPNQLGFDYLAHELKEMNIKSLNFQDWQKIDSAEVKLGESKGKSRVKFVDNQKVFTVLNE